MRWVGIPVSGLMLSTEASGVDGMQEDLKTELDDPLDEGDKRGLAIARERLERHSMYSELPYSPQDTADLEDLGIDATRRTREAHTALQQISWLEAWQNMLMIKESLLEDENAFSSLVDAFRCTHGEGIIPVGEEGERVTASFLSNLCVRGPGRRLTFDFIIFFNEVCVFNCGDGLRDYSLEKFRRGDYCRISAAEARGCEVEQQCNDVDSSAEVQPQKDIGPSPRAGRQSLTRRIREHVVAKLMQNYDASGYDGAKTDYLWRELNVDIRAESSWVKAIAEYFGYSITHYATEEGRTIQLIPLSAGTKAGAQEFTRRSVENLSTPGEFGSPEKYMPLVESAESILSGNPN